MTQSVDFLKVLPKPANRIPTWLMAILIVAPLFLLIILSITTYINYYNVHANLTRQEENLKTVRATYNSLIQKYPLLASNVPLLTQVSILEQQYHAKLDKFESLKHLIVRPGFSRYLLNLAQVTPDSLWLDRILIDHSSALVTVNGYAVRPDSVSELMSNLSTTNAFREVLFNSFFVKAIKNHSYAKFSISTQDISPTASVLEELDPETTKAKE